MLPVKGRNIRSNEMPSRRTAMILTAIIGLVASGGTAFGQQLQPLPGSMLASDAAIQPPERIALQYDDGTLTYPSRTENSDSGSTSQGATSPDLTSPGTSRSPYGSPPGGSPASSYGGGTTSSSPTYGSNPAPTYGTLPSSGGSGAPNATYIPPYRPATPLNSPAPHEGLPSPLQLAPPRIAPNESPTQEQNRGFFQHARFEAAWLIGTGQNNIDVVELEAKTRLAIPFVTRETPLGITPGFESTFFSSNPPGVPDVAHRAYVELMHKRPFGEQLMTYSGVTLGWHSDFKQSNSDAFRFEASLIGVWTHSPEWQFVAGLLYLDRPQIKFLPVGGLLWRPRTDLQVDLVFPKPKISRRTDFFTQSLHPRDPVQDWVYISGDYGGNVWAVDTPGPVTDMMSYRDYRIAIGFQRKRLGGIDFELEAGYVFARKFEFESGAPSIRPSEALMLQAKFEY